MTIEAIVTLVISSVSLVVATTTAWLTLLQPGTVRMVRPALVAFLDARGSDGPKVWFRTLLYSTSRRGNVIESMFVRLRRGESRQNFSFWVCGDGSQLAGGCGLYVGQSGTVLNHHFVLPKDGTRYEFLPGEYVLEVFATLVGQRQALQLAAIPLHLSGDHAKALKNADENIYFNWWPDSGRYNAHVVRRKELSADLPDLLAGIVAAAAIDLPPRPESGE